MPSPRQPIKAPRQLARIGMPTVPALFLDAGQKASWRLIEFFTANIRNRNTREAYARAVGRFCRWCEKKNVALEKITPFIVAAYIEQLSATFSRPSVKQHLAALSSLCDYLVVGQVLPTNPAASVRGPRYVVKKGKTPVMSAQETRTLLDSIDTSTIIGLRDRALISIMLFGFARIGAVLAMNWEDYFPQRRRWWFRLHEKGGKRLDVPAHAEAAMYVTAYLTAAGMSGKTTPLFRTVNGRAKLTDRRLSRREALAMIKRRAVAAGLPSGICCHSLRGTGITVYLLNGGSLEHAQQIAAHESPKTTKLYDRRSDLVSEEEIDRIRV